MVYLIMFFIVSSGSVLAAAYGKKRYEETLPLTFMLMILLLYAFSLVGALSIGFYGVLAASTLCYGLAIWISIRRRDLKGTLSRLLTPGFAMYFLLFAAVCVLQRVRMLTNVDEYRLWGPVAKTLYSLNALGTSPASVLWPTVRGYPPGMALLQYLWERIQGRFTDGVLFMAYEAYCFALLMPALKGLEWKQWKRLPAILLSVMILPLVFFNSNNDYANFYTSIFIDAALGITFGYVAALPLLDGERLTAFGLVRQCAGLAVLALLKDTGTALAAIAFAVIVAHYAAKKKEWPALPARFAATKKRWVYAAVFACLVAAPLLAAVAWKINLAATQTAAAFSNTLTWSMLSDVLRPSGASYRTDVLKNFIAAISDTPILQSVVPLSLKSLSVLFAGVFALLVFCYRDTAHRRMKLTAAVLMGGIAAYALGLLYLYLFQFPSYDAVALASYPRYMSIFFCGLAIYVYFAALPLLWREAPKDAVQPFGRRVAFALALLMLFATPFLSWGGLNALNPQSAAASAARNKPYTQAAATIARSLPHSQGPKNVYIIIEGKQPDTSVPYFAIRYQLVSSEAHLNSDWWSWNLFSPDSTSSQQDAAVTKWVDALRNGYDYVYLYQVDETFKEKLAFLFDGGISQIQANRLYQITKTNDTVVLKKVS